MSPQYRLIYWPSIPGRGEPVRLVMAAAGVDWVDVARLPEAEGGGVAVVRRYMRGEAEGWPPYAPPILVDGPVVLAQLPVLVRYLGERHGLAPEDAAGRARVQQLFLTCCDVWDEAHDTHHPVSTALYYEDQRDAAARAARHFREERVPKYLAFFDRALADADGPWLAGRAMSTADIGWMHLVDGLTHAFPRAFGRALGAHPDLAALADRVRRTPRIAAYLRSDRRIPFNEDGLFRRYPELDAG